MITDILFIHPGDNKNTYQSLSKEFTAVSTPTWAALIANFIRNKGYSVAIYDVNIEGWDESTSEKLISHYNPRLIAVMVYGHNPSSSTQTMPAAGMIAKAIKEYNRGIPLVMGGLHPSVLPERTLAEEDIDFVAQGEGLYTIEGLIRHIKRKEDIRGVKGLWFKDRGKIAFTSPVALVDDLDQELGDYAWDLLPDFGAYRAHNMHCFQYSEQSKTEDFSDVRSPYAVINTSLGCPYSCYYCCANGIFGRSTVRYWSVKKVMDWIDILAVKYRVKNVRFDDEYFDLSSQRLEQLCDLIIGRGYDLNIWVYGQAGTIEQSILKKLRKAGINWICLGIESGNDRVRRNFSKSTQKNIYAAVKAIQDNDICVLGNYMFGFFNDNLDSMEETFNLSLKLNCEFANFYSVMAYPGSKLYNWSLSKKILLPDSWEGFSQHSYSALPLATDFLSGEQVLGFRDKAFYRYYTNPAYLKMMRSKFGEKVVLHIKKMANLKIERRMHNIQFH